MESLFILSERQITEINPFSLPSKPFTERKRLPNIPAVYFLIKGETVHYVGQSISLVLRWSSHSLVSQVSSLEWDLDELRISYFHCPETWLSAIESRMIDRFMPLLNSSIPKIDSLPEVEAALSDIESEADDLHRQLKKLSANKYSISLLNAQVAQGIQELKTEIGSMVAAVSAAEEESKLVSDRLLSMSKKARDAVLGCLVDEGFFDPKKRQLEFEKMYAPILEMVNARGEENLKRFEEAVSALAKSEAATAAEMCADYLIRHGVTKEEFQSALKKSAAKHQVPTPAPQDSKP